MTYDIILEAVIVNCLVGLISLLLYRVVGLSFKDTFMCAFLGLLCVRLVRLEKLTNND